MDSRKCPPEARLKNNPTAKARTSACEASARAKSNHAPVGITQRIPGLNSTWQRLGTAISVGEVAAYLHIHVPNCHNSKKHLPGNWSIKGSIRFSYPIWDSQDGDGTVLEVPSLYLYKLEEAHMTNQESKSRLTFVRAEFLPLHSC